MDGPLSKKYFQAVTTATSSGMTIVQHNPTTTTATIGNENQEMIVSDQNNDQGGSQDEYITLQMPDGSQGQTMVLAQEGAEGEQGEQGIYSGLTNFFSKYFCTYDFTIF